MKKINPEQHLAFVMVSLPREVARPSSVRAGRGGGENSPNSVQQGKGRKKDASPPDVQL